jgi:hypothetical protein
MNQRIGEKFTQSGNEIFLEISLSIFHTSQTKIETTSSSSTIESKFRNPENQTTRTFIPISDPSKKLEPKNNSPQYSIIQNYRSC